MRQATRQRRRDVTDASDTNSNVDWDTATDEDMADLPRLLADNVHPPECYIRQWEEFDELEYAKEDYNPGTTLLLDKIEEQWFR